MSFILVVFGPIIIAAALALVFITARSGLARSSKGGMAPRHARNRDVGVD